MDFDNSKRSESTLMPEVLNIMIPDFINRNISVDSLIVESAKQYDNSIAVKGINKNYTYSELLSLSTHISKQLHNIGVKKGDRVCLICERDFQGLAVAIGIMLCGAIYVPISIEYPDARIRFIIEDSKSEVVITDGKKSLDIFKLKNIYTIELLLSELSIEFSDTYFEIEKIHSSKDIAYILYTSGSSGRPKGVVVSHEALLNTFFWMIEAFDLKPGECIPQKTSWSFTDSLWEMFLPLIYGGIVGFVSEIQVRQPLELYSRLNKVNAVITQFVPPAVSVFLDEIEKHISNPEIPSLRWVLNGGEELPRKIADRWFAIFPNIGYANSYGMTESAIYATCYFMKEPPVWGMRRILVGTPISNSEVYIISESGNVQAEEVIGEICIGGKSLMTKYWNQPELTKKAFVAHPETGDNLYKTGDYGAYRKDGQIAYLGRIDDQVKILGMRVELKEIQRVMLDHPSVKQAYVLTKNINESKILAAFYTTGDSRISESSLLAYLRTVLPHYMVPAICVRLDEMPLTEHNKTDLKKLANMPLQNNQFHYSQHAFGCKVEKHIHSIWKNILGHSNYGPDDPFFYVGGNSLMLLRVYGQLHEKYQRLLTIPDLLNYPTIRSLAKYILAKNKIVDAPVPESSRRRRLGRLSEKRMRMG